MEGMRNKGQDGSIEYDAYAKRISEKLKVYNYILETGTVFTNYGGYGSYSGTTYSMPTFGQVGSIPYSEDYKL